jgi:hypothetical protein
LVGRGALEEVDENPETRRLSPRRDDGRVPKPITEKLLTRGGSRKKQQQIDPTRNHTKD